MRLAQRRAGPPQGQNNHASQSARTRQKKEDSNSCAGRGFRLPRDEATRELNDPRRHYLAMKPTPIISEKKAAIVIWIGAAVFTIGAMIFGH
jgi:hypothetical protein